MRAELVRLLLLVLLAALVPGTASAEEDEAPRARWQGVRVEAVERLHALATWCASARLFAARAETYERVLAFDPDDEVARKWLRYERAADGTWNRRSHYTPPRDLSRSRDRYEERHAALGAWLAEEALAVVAAAGEAHDVALRSRILAVATQVAPEAADLRRENGEILVESPDASRWILVESRIARERRRDLLRAAKDAVAAVPDPQPGTPGTGDDAGVVPWGRILQGEQVRVLGLPDEVEMRTQYRYCEACWPVFRAALHVDPPTWSTPGSYARGVSVYVFDDVRRGNAFLDRQPDVPERYRAFAERLAALWIPGRPAVLIKSDNAQARLEAGPKQILGGMSATVLDIRAQDGWASEGLDHYLVYLITGTRILSSMTDPKSRYGQPQPGLPDVAPRAIDQDDWLRRGLALLRSDEKPDFFLMVGKSVNDLTTSDVLYGYCIVAYLVEGRPQACAPFLRAVGASENVDLEPLVQAHLGFDVAALEARVLRWLDETTRETPR